MLPARRFPWRRAPRPWPPPPPNAASSLRCAHAGFQPPGTGEGALVSTPMITPDRSVVLAVAVTETGPAAAGRIADVSTTSAVWSVPLLAVTVLSAVHPMGANACPAAVLSPVTAAMRHADAEGAGSARLSNVAALAKLVKTPVTVSHGPSPATSSTRRSEE